MPEDTWLESGQTPWLLVYTFRGAPRIPATCCSESPLHKLVQTFLVSACWGGVSSQVTRGKESPTPFHHFAEWVSAPPSTSLSPSSLSLLGDTSEGDKHTFKGLSGWGCSSWKTFQGSEKTAFPEPRLVETEPDLLLVAALEQAWIGRQGDQW